MIRVVLDANVLVSAALARDSAAPSVGAFDALLDGRNEAVGCAARRGRGGSRARPAAPLSLGDLLELQDIGVTVITPRELIKRVADAP